MDLKFNIVMTCSQVIKSEGIPTRLTFSCKAQNQDFRLTPQAVETLTQRAFNVMRKATSGPITTGSVSEITFDATGGGLYLSVDLNSDWPETAKALYGNAGEISLTLTGEADGVNAYSRIEKTAVPCVDSIQITGAELVESKAATLDWVTAVAKTIGWNLPDYVRSVGGDAANHILSKSVRIGVKTQEVQSASQVLKSSLQDWSNSKQIAKATPRRG